MKRRALIIYCDNTESGKLHGPIKDEENYRNFLTSSLGGDWYDQEILSLRNPSSVKVVNAIKTFLSDADYTFIIFSGHGFINLDHNKLQYVELLNKSISIKNLTTNAPRQTMIIDACRGYYSPSREILKIIGEKYEHFIGDIESYSTRKLFEKAVLKAEKGLTILFAASEDESALDTDKGGSYLLSLLRIAEIWAKKYPKNSILTLKPTHEAAKRYLKTYFLTIQNPTMNLEKRLNYFPFAVKFPSPKIALLT